MPRRSQLLLSLPVALAAGPLKVFVMVGQSNMAGHGFYDKRDASGKPLNGTLEWLATDPRTSAEFSKLKTVDGWAKRKDVWITYNFQDAKVTPTPVIGKHGELSVGFGGPPNPHQDMLGPELGFGWTIGDALQDQVLLLKVAWGGKSLAVDYRPPSSGGKTGPYYKVMIQSVQLVLGQLNSLFPSFSGNYDIAGFVWHQGWNDACDGSASSEYEKNLANLIRDVRKDLGVPHLPVSIGVSGMGGWSGHGAPGALNSKVVPAQLAVANAAKYPEFKGTVVAVETRDFFRERDSEGGSPGHQIYHWNNNCESYWLAGKAMANGMLKLLPGPSPSPPVPTPAPTPAPTPPTPSPSPSMCSFTRDYELADGYTDRVPLESKEACCDLCGSKGNANCVFQNGKCKFGKSSTRKHTVGAMLCTQGAPELV
jgi:alpha-galactosidase